MKLKATHALALCALSLLTAQPVWAATVGPDTELKVTGKITPGSCTVKLDGEAKYKDDIAADTIRDVAEGTDLKNAPPVLLTINCGEKPTQVGVSLTDNVAESRVNGLKIDSYKSDAKMFGLGMSNGDKIGAYMITLTKPVVDGVDSRLGQIKEGESTVDGKYTDEPLWANELSARQILITWVALGGGTLIPKAGKIFTGTLDVRAAINQRSALNLTNDVQLAGSSKLTVYYL